MIRKRLQAARKQKFVRDTLVLQAASLVQSGTYLVTSLLTARLLGKFELGRWATSRELYMFLFFLVNMGLTNAAVSRYSHAKGSGDERKSVFALAALLKLGGIMATALLLMGWGLAPALAEHYYDDRDVGLVTAVLTLAVVGEVLRSMTLAIFNGTRQMRVYATFDVITNVARVGLVGGALLLSPTPMSVAWAFVVHATLSGAAGLVAYRWARRLPPELAPPPLGDVLRAVPAAPLASFFGLSFLLALSKAMNVVVPRLGMLFIPAVAAAAGAVATGFEDNGAFQVGNVLNMVLAGAIGAIATNVLPTLGQKMGRSDVGIEELGHALRRVSLTAGGLAIAMTLASLPFMWLVVTYGYGTQYRDAFSIYVLLAMGNLAAGFAVIVEPFYIYAKRMHHHVAQSLVYAALVTAGIYSATVRWGPMGAAAAAGLGRLVVVGHLVYIYVYFRRARARNGPPGDGETPPPHDPEAAPQAPPG